MSGPPSCPLLGAKHVILTTFILVREYFISCGGKGRRNRGRKGEREEVKEEKGNEESKREREGGGENMKF